MTVGSSILLIGGIFPGLALATHETDHRFTVFGHVRDEKGQPEANVRVIVVDKRLDRANTTFSDSEGYYEALLHLHSEDLGDEIAVMAGDRQKTIRADFDPEDHKTERKVQVDFGAAPSSAPVVEETPVWIYGAAAAAVLLVMAAIGVKRFRKTGRPTVQKKTKQKKRH